MVTRREKDNVDAGEESIDRDGEGEGEREREECGEDGEEDGRSSSLRSLVDCFGFSGKSFLLVGSFGVW